MSLRAIRIFAPLATLVAVLSCGGADSLTPPTFAVARPSDPTLLAGLHASGPVATHDVAFGRIGANGGAALSAANGSAAASVEVSWVSLAPGTISDGTAATILNLRTGQRDTVPIVDGGFDPQPIPASLGDTVEVSVSRPGKPDAAARLSVSKTGPTIVRTRPPGGQTDAPLNTIITLVFSEPLDPASVNPTSVTLTTAGSPVPGEVRVLPGAGYIAEFTPSALLAPRTAYSLTVRGVVSLAGAPLAAPTSIPFMTSATVDSDTAIVVFGGQATREIPVSSHFTAWGMRRGSPTGTMLPTTWRSRDTSIATVTPWGNTTFAGDVVGIRPGTTVIEGSALGVTTTIAVTVLAPAPASAVSPVVVGFRMLVVKAELGPGLNHWSFGPELVLTDTTGRGGSAIIGVSFDERAGQPGDRGPYFDFVNTVPCNGVGAVGPDPLVVNYTTLHTLVVETWNYGTLPQWSGEAVVHVTLRIPGPAAMTIDVRAPIVPSSVPTLSGGNPANVLSCWG